MAFGDMAVVGYSDKISAAPGETITFMVSCEGAKRFQADIVRVISGDMNPAGPGFKTEPIETSANGAYPGRRQSVHPGSLVVVPSATALDRLANFTVQAMIWPTTPDKGEQTLIARWKAHSKLGFRLMIDDSGALALMLGDGSGKVETFSCGKAMVAREWYFCAAAFDAKRRTVTLHQEPLRRHALDASTAEVTKRSKLRPKIAVATDLTMAAHVARQVRGRNATAAHFNGKIDSPRLCDRALNRAEMNQLLQSVIPNQLRTTVVGAWDFSRDISGIGIHDLSGNGLHGETVNLPARAMTGYNWTGAEASWRVVPEQYGAIHFHDDDLYDAGWEPSFSLKVPNNMRSGCYAAWIRAGGDEDYLPFYVRPARGKPQAKILYLAPTASYMAYANFLFEIGFAGAELQSRRLVVVQPWHEYLNLHPELGRSQYDLHSDGSGICYSSRLRPILNMRPKVITPAAGGDGAGGLWAYNADTHLTDWLEAMGHRFDVLTDEDLERDGVSALRDYNVVISGTHPEYYSPSMWDAVKSYTEDGGRLMYMGGNGFYWRIDFHPDLPGVIEVRRGGESTRAWRAEPGEEHHSFSGELGGTWRRLGRPPQALAASGFVAQGFDFCTHFLRTPESKNPRAAWMFSDIGEREKIGDFGLCGGGAAGLEVDVADRSLGTPPHALVVATSNELSDSYLLVAEELLVSLPNSSGTTNPRVRAEIVFCEMPNDGALWSSSSIAWCGALSHNGYDNNVSRLTNNVLRRFARNAPINSDTASYTSERLN